MKNASHPVAVAGEHKRSFGLLTVYLRHERTVDSLLPEHLKGQMRYHDVVVYADKTCSTFLGRFPWDISSKPRKSAQTVMLNCYRWRVEWVDVPPVLDFAIAQPDAYKQRLIAMWGGAMPTSISIMEFLGTASRRDDYVLRESGQFTPDWISGDPVVSFQNLDDAIAAMQNLPNDRRRQGSILGVLPSWN